MNNKTANFQLYRDSCTTESKTPVYALAQGLDAIPPSEVKTMKAMFEKGNFETIVVGSDELNEGVVKDRPATSISNTSLLRDSFGAVSMMSSASRLFSGSRAVNYSGMSSTINQSISPSKKAMLLDKHKSRISTDLNALKDLVNMICEYVEKHPYKVRTLKFYGVRFGKTMIQSLARCIKASKSLEELSVIWCRLVTRDLGVIYKPLSTAYNIKILDFSGNRFDDKAGELLAMIFSQHGHVRDEIVWANSIRNEIPEKDPKEMGLREIDLSENALGNKSARELAHFVQYDGWVKTLNLKGNKIGEEGMNDLLKALLTNKTMFTLELRENPGYTPQIADQLQDRLEDNIQGYRQSVQTILTNPSSKSFLVSSLSKSRLSAIKSDNKSGKLLHTLNKSQTPSSMGRSQKLKDVPSDFFRTQTTGASDSSRTLKVGRDIPLYIDASSVFAPNKQVVKKEKRQNQPTQKEKSNLYGLERNVKSAQPQQKKPKSRVKGKMGLTMEELEDRLLDAEAIIAQLQLENHHLKMSLGLQGNSQNFDMDPRYDGVETDPNTQNSQEQYQMNPQYYYDHGELPPITEEANISNRRSSQKNRKNSEQEEVIDKIKTLMSEVTNLMGNLDTNHKRSDSNQKDKERSSESAQKYQHSHSHSENNASNDGPNEQPDEDYEDYNRMYQ